MTRRAVLDPAAPPYDAGSAGTAGRNYRAIPTPRPPADPTPTPQPAGGAHNEKGNKP